MSSSSISNHRQENLAQATDAIEQKVRTQIAVIEENTLSKGIGTGFARDVLQEVVDAHNLTIS